MSITFKHNDDGIQGKLIVEVDGTEAGFIQYKWLENGNIDATRTLVYDDFRTHKLGTPLFEKLIEFVEEKGIKVFPTCPFVAKTFARKPALQHLLADDYQAPQD